MPTTFSHTKSLILKIHIEEWVTSVPEARSPDDRLTKFFANKQWLVQTNFTI